MATVVGPGERALLYLGATNGSSAALADALGASRRQAPPAMPPAPTWAWPWRAAIDDWRAAVSSGPLADGVVVCTWPASVTATPMLELESPEWRAQVEWPLALWFQTLAAAADRCA